MMKSYLILVLLAVVTLPQTTNAQPAASRVVVQHKDLDLRADAGTKTLQHRIRRAVIAACGAAPSVDLVGQQEVRKCRAATMREVNAKAERLIAQATEAKPLRTAAVGN